MLVDSVTALSLYIYYVYDFSLSLSLSLSISLFFFLSLVLSVSICALIEIPCVGGKPFRATLAPKKHLAPNLRQILPYQLGKRAGALSGNGPEIV